MNSNETQSANASQQREGGSLTLNDATLLSITGAEFALVRELLQRSRDEHVSRVRDNAMGLSALDVVIARYAQQTAQQAATSTPTTKAR